MASPWLTPSVVRQYAGLRAGDAVDEAALTMAADAAAEFVEDLPGRVTITTTDDGAGGTTTTYTVGPRVLLGAAMLASRWYSRRSSPLGVAGYVELGQAGILRHDPDVAKLLRLGESGPFVFGAPTATTTETA